MCQSSAISRQQLKQRVNRKNAFHMRCNLLALLVTVGLEGKLLPISQKKFCDKLLNVRFIVADENVFSVCFPQIRRHCFFKRLRWQSVNY